MGDENGDGPPAVAGNLLTTLLAAELQPHLIQTEYGHLHVFVQGDLEKLRESQHVFLTVHDIGSNHNSWVSFAKQEEMNGVTEKSLYLHICVPGQETGAEDLGEDFNFPSMQQLGEELLTVLDVLRVHQVVGLGAGAGANIVARFAMKNPNRVHGIILIQPVAGVSSFGEQIKGKVSAFKRGTSIDMDKFMIFHKFGKSDEDKDIQIALQEFKNRLHKDINAKNLKMYVDSFLSRDDISCEISLHMRSELLTMVGAKSSFVKATKEFHKLAPMRTSSIIVMDDVTDILDEVPEKFQESLLFFIQGLGLLPQVASEAVSRENSRRASLVGGRKGSMMDADVPNIRRLSLTSA